MGIDDIAGLADMCDVEELQEVVEYCLGCNPNMKYHYQDASRCRAHPEDPMKEGVWLCSGWQGVGRTWVSG